VGGASCEDAQVKSALLRSEIISWLGDRAGGWTVTSSNDEIVIASAAPTLEHADLCLGVRTLSMAFRWHNREVGGVAFLMFEHGHLTESETAWLAGFVGLDAPATDVSPLG
jgi:hypothetical protein